MKRWIKPLLVSVVPAIPGGGFLFGFVTCDDCGWNVFGRAFIGCVMAVLTSVSLGFPPKNEGGVGEPYNAWPYILIAWAVCFCVLFWREKRKK